MPIDVVKDGSKEPENTTKDDVPQQTYRSYSNNSMLRTFKIIVVGDSNVGKTCLTYRFCERKFPKTVEATIGLDFRDRVVEIDGESIMLQFWDTAGQERFRRSMIHHYYRNAHAIVFVYDMTKSSSFYNLSSWIDECNEFNLKPDRVPRILVGNKCDTKDTIVISRSIALRFADNNHMPLFETSALLDSELDHIDAIFMTLAYKLKNSKSMMLSPQHEAPTKLKLDKQEQTSAPEESCCSII